MAKRSKAKPAKSARAVAGAAKSKLATAVARTAGARRRGAAADAGRIAKGARPTAPAAGAGASAAAAAARVRVARVAKGRKPQYFSDPAIDKLLWITMTLAGELSVARDRLDAVERLLEAKRVLKVADVDGYEPTPEAERAREARRQQYLDRVLRAVQAELEEVTGTGMPKSQDEVWEAVAS